MKICISSEGKSLESRVASQFGRCAYFVIVDTDTKSVESIPNPGTKAPGGAGVQAAETVASTKAKVLLTGRIGPSAFPILSEAGIELRIGIEGTVSDALKQYETGSLELLETPNSSAHSPEK
jgi:predicted Fe-Mo cluster-binding NifX family protein